MSKRQTRHGIALLTASLLLISTAGAKSALDVTDEQLMGEIRTQWGQNVNPKSVKKMAKDVTCDGATDQIATRVNLDNPEGPSYDILVVTKNGGSLFTGNLGLGQDSLCSDITKSAPKLTIETLKAAETKEMVGDGACTTAIKVDSGECDATWFFWLIKGQGDARFTMFSN